MTLAKDKTRKIQKEGKDMRGTSCQEQWGKRKKKLPQYNFTSRKWRFGADKCPYLFKMVLSCPYVYAYNLVWPVITCKTSLFLPYRKSSVYTFRATYFNMAIKSLLINLFPGSDKNSIQLRLYFIPQRTECSGTLMTHPWFLSFPHTFDPFIKFIHHIPLNVHCVLGQCSWKTRDRLNQATILYESYILTLYVYNISQICVFFLLPTPLLPSFHCWSISTATFLISIFHTVKWSFKNVNHTKTFLSFSSSKNSSLHLEQNPNTLKDPLVAT